MRIIYLLAGLFFAGLGALGATLPVLPTVPLLLVSAFCFSRSSHKADAWFRSTWLYKKHLQAFMTHRSMLLRTKVILLAFTTLLLAFLFITVDSLILRVLLPLISAGQYLCFIFWIKTRRSDRKVCIPETTPKKEGNG